MDPNETTAMEIMYSTRQSNVPDERTLAVIRERMSKLNSIDGPRVGDWVDFGNDTSQRISHIWPDGAQTSKGGTYYLGNGYVSMSGSLDPCVPLDSLTRTNETRPGSVWVFQHDWHQAHNGVDVQVPFRVYRTTCNDPRNPKIRKVAEA